MRFDPAKIRLYVDAPLQAGEAVGLEKDQAHYLGTVMRQKAGDAVHLFNGRDGEWRAQIEEISRKSATLRVETQTREQSSGPDVWLVFA
ncbi:MAG: RNA methyltransferase PUA domain-containing protein, partial [Alphaproteobacteria bacterium]|nr:RNA methyltransferase PUA domain-containing protein [Alphaproteobacteria bacterium]